MNTDERNSMESTAVTQPTVYLVIAGSAIAFDEGGEILEAVDWTTDGKPDWTDAGICDPRGGGAAAGFDALGRALTAAEENARLLGEDIVRVPKQQ